MIFIIKVIRYRYELSQFEQERILDAMREGKPHRPVPTRPPYGGSGGSSGSGGSNFMPTRPPVQNKPTESWLGGNFGAGSHRETTPGEI